MDSKTQGRFARLLKRWQGATNRGSVPDAQKAETEMMAMVARQLATEGPGEHVLLWQQGHDHQAAGRWAQAEEAYRAALRLSEAEGSPGMAYKDHEYLSGLYAAQGRADDTVAEARAALDAARAHGLGVLVAMGLRLYGRVLLGVGDPRGAHAAADEMLGLTTDERTDALMRAQALALRAECSVALGDLDAASRDLEAAWPLLAPRADFGLAAGVGAALASWWEVSATVRRGRGDLRGTTDALREAVRCRRAVAAAPQVAGPNTTAALAGTLRRLSETLAAAGDGVGAADAAAESAALLKGTGRPPARRE